MEHRADHHMIKPVPGHHAAGLGQAIDLDQGHAEHAKETHHVRRYRCRAGERHLYTAQAEEVLQGAKHAPVADEPGQAFADGPGRARLFRQALTGVPGPLEQRAPQAAGLLQLDADGGVHLFPDARHTQEHAGSDLAQVFLHGADGLAEVDLRAKIDRDEAGEHLLGHMAQRQIGQVAGALGQGQTIHDARHHTADVAVGDHRALGLAGGARGVDDETDVVQGLARQHGVDQCQLAAGGTGLFDFGEGGDDLPRLRRKAAQALGFHDHDLAQTRQLVERGEQLVGLLLVFADHDLDVGVAHHVGDFAARAGGVDAHRDAAHQAHAHLRQHPLDAVLRDHADMAALAQAQGAQTQTEMAGALVVAGPVHRLPDAEILLPDGDALAVQAHALAQHLRQGQFGQRCGLHIQIVFSSRKQL